MRNYIKIGVAGPVGSGKTALIERLTRQIADQYSVAVITNESQHEMKLAAGSRAIALIKASAILLATRA